jgi:hypothetical protein
VLAAYVMADAAALAWISIDAGLSVFVLGNLSFRTSVKRVKVRSSSLVWREHTASTQPTPDRRARDVKVSRKPSDDLGRIAA